MLYGSKKPYSDIDLFVVSNRSGEFSNHWINIRSITPGELDYKLSLLDIAITDPILTGEIIIGDKDYLREKVKQLDQQQISNETIYYNLIKAKEQRVYSKEHPKNSKLRSRGESYINTYMKNALSLKQGIKKLTKRELLSTTQ